MSTYPVHLNLRGRPVLVVGGGRVGAAKTIGLLAAGAAVTVVAPAAEPAIENEPAVRWFARQYRRGEVASYRLALTCTGDPAVDEQVYLDAEAAGVWVNSVDDLDRCSFVVPAVARSGDLTLTAATNGRSPALASWLRSRLESDLDHGLVQLLDLLAEIRIEVKAQRGSSVHPGWRRALDDGLLELIRAGQHETARRRLLRYVELEGAPT